jgi:hypothetical protein
MATAGDGRSRIVSLRLSESEHGRIREAARRLGTTEAAVLRFAVRRTLAELAPLPDPSASGLSLLPVFVERGAELAANFDLDAEKLDRIINQGLAPSRRRVDAEDLGLLAMCGAGDARVHAKLRDLRVEPVGPEGDAPAIVRAYFYGKYIYDKPPDSET